MGRPGFLQRPNPNLRRCWFLRRCPLLRRQHGVTRLASRLISRTLLVLSTPSPRSLTFSATHASALARRSPPFPPLLAMLAWPRPLLVFSRLFAKTTEWASSPRSLRSTPESSRPKPVKFQSRSPPLSSSLLNRNPKSPKPLPPCSETRLPSSPLLSTALFSAA